MHDNKFKSSILSMISLIFLFASCINESDKYIYDFTTGYRINDTIPYNIIGEGKLVFNRIVFCPAAHFSTTYIVDINQQKIWHCENMNDPSISPDGKKLVYCINTTNNNPNNGVYISDIDGTNRQRVSDKVAFNAVWTPDGTQILYITKQQGSEHIHIKLYRQSPVPNAINRVLVVDFWYNNPPFIPEGNITLSSKGKYLMSSGEIYTFDENGKNCNKIIPLQTDSQHFHSPAWSPDGNKVAVILVDFHKNKIIKTYNILVFNADGSNRDTLISVLDADKSWYSVDSKYYSLCWSPDGNQIAFNLPIEPSFSYNSNIYVIKTDHTRLTRVTTNVFANDYNLSWGR